MNQGYLNNIQAMFPNTSNNPYSIFKPQINTNHALLNGFKINQSVQFLKLTVLPSGKVSYKESMGKILKFNNEYADILDNLGDIVQTKLHNIKVVGL